jgi:1-acyl-sn-glycerol-3-phosphate acyltransferase
MKKLKVITHILLIKIILKNFLRWIIGVSFEQEKKLATFEQCIFVANHNSHLDTVCFLSLIPTKKFLTTHPVAAGDYFSKNKLIEKTVKFIFNVIIIERKTLRNFDSSLKGINEALAQGHSVLFFPEGSRGQPEVMSDFKNGIAVLLKSHPGIPFVPMYMRGLGLAMPKGDPMLVPHESKIMIGDPVLIPGIENLPNAEVVQRVREEILKLNA